MYSISYVEPDRRFTFFNPPARLCAVTYITEISLRVTLSNQSHSHALITHIAFIVKVIVLDSVLEVYELISLVNIAGLDTIVDPELRSGE